MKQILKNFRNVFHVVIMFFSHAAFGGDINVKAKGGTIHYSLQIGNDIVKADTLLSDDSYVYLSGESSIVVADPLGQFYIGVVGDGVFSKEKIRQATQDKHSRPYTLASYLVYDAQTHTMGSVPFNEGYVTIARSDSGCYKIAFQYSLKDQATDKQITLKGEAIFETEGLAVRRGE